MTATGVDLGGETLTDNGDGFVITEGGSVTYNLRNNITSPTLLGDRVRYTVSSEINDSDLAPNSNKLHSSLYLDNSGLGNTDISWVRIGTLNRPIDGRNIYLDYNTEYPDAASVRAQITVMVAMILILIIDHMRV